MTTSPNRNTEKALASLAWHLADEMRYINYPLEWSREPLSSLVPVLFNLLNYHPAKLGDILENAYINTFPASKSGNINQLSQTYPAYFKQNYDFFENEYFVQKLRVDKPSTQQKDATPYRSLTTIAQQIIRIFAVLTPKQENEHRTLERLCYALEPLYYCVEGLSDTGWVLAEHADFWRKLHTDERRKLAEGIMSSIQTNAEAYHS